MSYRESNDATDFEKYIVETVKETDKALIVRLTLFSQSLIECIGKEHRHNTGDYLCAFTDTIDLSELINQSDDSMIIKMKTVTVGRFILLTITIMEEQIKNILKNDFPKYLGERSNLWRYLTDMISKFLREVNPDFTTQFLVANACILEVIAYCFALNQFQITKHDMTIWVGIILHFFGERLRGRKEETAVLQLDVRTIDGIKLVTKQKKGIRKIPKLIIPLKKK